MKPRRRVRLQLVPVPPGYDPGYPAALSPADYRRLVAPGVARRAARVALAAGLVAAAPGRAPGGQEGPGADREQRVLELVRRLAAQPGERNASWYARATFMRRADRDPHVWVPAIPICFGNSVDGVFDAGRARELGRELFEAWGLAPRADERFETASGGARIDVWDPARRVGFELRAGADPLRVLLGEAVQEPEGERLDDEERRELEQAGARLHVAEVGDYALMDGDQFTPTLAFLAGLVSFLNEVTDGPDVDLSAVLLQRAQRFAFPAPEALALPPGVDARRDGEVLVLAAERPAAVRLEFDGARCAPDARRRGPLLRTPGGAPPAPPDPTPYPTAGAPTVLHLRASQHPVHGRERTPERFTARLLQEGRDGAPAIDVRAPGGLLFAPSRFDATRPFALELELPAGQLRLHEGGLLVGAPGR